MTTKHRLALGTIFVAALLAVFLLLDDGDEAVEVETPVQPGASEARGDADLDGAGMAAAVETEAPARVPVAEAAPTTLDPLVVPEGGRPFEFEVRVVDQYGIAVEGAEMFAAPHGLPLNRLGSTGEDGRVSAKWYGRTANMELVYYVRRNGRSSSLIREVLFAEDLHRALVPLESPVLQLRRGTGRNFVIQGTLITGLGSGGAGGEAPEVVRRESGEVGFRDPLGWRGSEADGTVMQVVSFGSGMFLNLSDVGIVFSSDVVQAEEAPPRASIAGVVRNRAGDPVGGVPITLGPDEWRVRMRMESDGEGRFLFEDLEPRDYRLRAGGGPYGLAFLEVVVAEGEHLEWNPTLDRGRETAGVLTTEEGAPLEGWRVELSLRNPRDPWVAVAKTGPDGRFVVPNCPAGPLRLEFFAPEQPHLPTLVIDGVRADGVEARYVLATADRLASAAQIGVESAEHEVLRPAKVRLWQPTSDRGTWFAGMEEGDRRQAREVPPGFYEVEAGYARWGWIEAGPFFIARGDTATDLGMIQLPTPQAAPGTLVLQLDPADSTASSPLTWSLHRQGDEVVAEVLAAKEAFEPGSLPGDVEIIAVGEGLGIPMRAGEFVLRLHHPAHGTVDFPFAVLPAEVVGLRVTRDEDNLRVEQVEVPRDGEGE